MIDFDNQTETPVDLALFSPLADYLKLPDIELLIIDNPTMQEINAQTRGIDAPTDVLSFPLERHHAHEPLGSILISIDKAREVCVTLGHSIEAELQLLFIHGALHLLGFDHECDDGEMRAKEAEVIAHFHLPQSLIVRTLG